MRSVFNDEKKLSIAALMHHSERARDCLEQVLQDAEHV
jgi:hypothetical protein